MYQILLVNVDELSSASLKKALHKEGYQLNDTSDLNEAHAIASGGWVDLILLNWHSPTSNHIDFIKRIKSDEKTKKSRLILLAACDVEEDTVQGLKAGADDYLTKPFSEEALMKRAHAWLAGGEGHGEQDNDIRYDALCIDESSHLVTIAGKLVQLGPTEFRLLSFFMRHPNQAFRRKQLITHVWNDPDVEQRTVDVHIRRLRKALAPHSYDRYLQTIRTVGYRFSSYGVSTRQNII